MSRHVVIVSGFIVQNLGTLCLSTNMVLSVWKRFACQWIWCSEFGNVSFLNEFGVPRVGNVVPVNGFGVQSLETLYLSAVLMLRIWNVACISELGVATLETFCLSAGLVFRIWKRCACQRIWC